MAMRSRFRAKKEIIPVLLADVLFHLFSDNIKERNFMVRGWCQLDAYSRQDVTAEYPLGYTAQNGPVPIKMASASAPYATNGPAASSPKGNGVYRWTDDQYRWAILALRAVSVSPSPMYMSLTPSRSALRHNTTSIPTKGINTLPVRMAVLKPVTIFSPPCSSVKTDGPQAVGTRISLRVQHVTLIRW